MSQAPGKSYREGTSLIDLHDMFPTEEAAREWFDSVIWPEGRHCPKCRPLNTKKASHKKMPYWCTDCRSYFSVKTGTAMQASKVPLRKWAIAIYLCITNLKSVSSMKLKRDIKMSQPTAWCMLQRIREAWGDGPVEFDETYVGGKRKNKSNAECKKLGGCGPVDMTATDKATRQGFVDDMTDPDTEVYTDDAKTYRGILNPHETVKHSVSQFANGMAHTNGIESFWSMLKRAHKGTFHKNSPKHRQRYVSEFEGKHNIRESDTLYQMRDTVARPVGRVLLYRDFIACNGLFYAGR